MGLGALVSVVLAVTGWAGEVVKVFQVIGASFGPVCGAMLADYWLSGGKWSGRSSVPTRTNRIKGPALA